MGKLSSILLGTISGAATAVFLTSKKGKVVTEKVGQFIKEVAENPADFKDQVVQSTSDFSKQATDAIQQAKEKVENGEVTSDTVVRSVKEKTKQVFASSQEKVQQFKDTMDSTVPQNEAEEQVGDIIIELKSSEEETAE